MRAADFQNIKKSWLTKIPSHWNVVRIKTIVKSGTNGVWGNEPKNKKNDIVCIRVADIDEWQYGISKSDLTFRHIPEADQTGRLLNFGDLIIEKSGGGDLSPVGRVVIFNLTGKAVTSNFMARLNVIGDFNKEFLYYCFRFLYHRKLNHPSIKATTGIQNLDLYSYLQNPIPIPTPKEQIQIVNFINHTSEKITHFIQSKQRFIELLKEQRQSIITHAVTKGVDEKVEIKETSFGKIPKHWEVRRLGSIGRFSKGGNISRSELIYTEDGVPAILYGDIYTKYDIVAENIINRITEETALKSIELKKGDLLFTGSGETKEDIGKCVIFNNNEPAFAGGDVIIFKQDIFDSYFISYSQNSSIAKHQKAISSKGEIIVHTYGSKLRDIFMPYPPTIEEQRLIVEYIKTETRIIDIAINKAEREIELIKEYREAMIAEAVTGKLIVNL
jgi:type I restriction enzyme S subunit